MRIALKERDDLPEEEGHRLWLGESPLEEASIQDRMTSTRGKLGTNRQRPNPMEYGRERLQWGNLMHGVVLGRISWEGGS